MASRIGELFLPPRNPSNRDVEVMTTVDYGPPSGNTLQDGETGLILTNSIALTRLFEQRRTGLVLAALRITHNQDDAEDVVQEAALKAFTNLRTFRSESCLETWVWAIVRNCAISHLRNSSRRRSVSLDSGLAPGYDPPRWVPMAETVGPEENCLACELSEILRSEVESLKAPYRIVLSLCDLEGWSYLEAAVYLKLDRDTVKARLYRGRRTLQERVLTRRLKVNR